MPLAVDPVGQKYHIEHYTIYCYPIPCPCQLTEIPPNLVTQAPERQTVTPPLTLLPSYPLEGHHTGLRGVNRLILGKLDKLSWLVLSYVTTLYSQDVCWTTHNRHMRAYSGYSSSQTM